MSGRVRLLVPTAAAVLLGLAVSSSGGTGGDPQREVAALNRCDTFNLALAANTNGASGALTPNVSIFNTGPTACRLRANLTFSIRDSNGRLLPIRGNPARLTLHANRLARTGKPASVSWLWSNWCRRAKRPFIYQGRIGDLSVRFFERSTPRCDNGISSITILFACPQPENASLFPPRLRTATRLTCR